MNIRSKKILKISTFCLAALFLLWSSLWFFLAKSIENNFKNIHNDKYDLSYEKIEISGFPFYFKITLFDTKYKAEGSTFIIFDKLQLKTNLFFNKIKMILPNRSDIKMFFNEQLRNITIDSNKRAYFAAQSNQNFNALKILDMIHKKTFDTTNIDIKNLHFYGEELLFIDNDTNEVLSRDNINIEMMLDKKSDIVTGINLNFDLNEVNLNIKRHISNLRDLDLQGNLYILTQKDKIKNKENSYSYIMEYINIETLALKTNNSIFSLKGNVDYKNNDSLLNLDFSAQNWIELLDTLLSQNNISQEKYKLMIAIIKDITGIDDNQSPIYLKIYSDPLNGIKIGNSNASKLLIYFQKYLSTP